MQLSLQRKNVNSATEIEKIEKEKTLNRDHSRFQGLFLIFSIFYSFNILFLV